MFIYGHLFTELKETVKKDEQSEDMTVHKNLKKPMTRITA